MNARRSGPVVRSARPALAAQLIAPQGALRDADLPVIPADLRTLLDDKSLTGVIDLGGFMRKLVAMDYVGPVTPEPFSQRVNELAAADPLAAARLVADAMDALWQAGGLR